MTFFGLLSSSLLQISTINLRGTLSLWLSTTDPVPVHTVCTWALCFSCLQRRDFFHWSAGTARRLALRSEWAVVLPEFTLKSSMRMHWPLGDVGTSTTLVIITAVILFCLGSRDNERISSYRPDPGYKLNWVDGFGLLPRWVCVVSSIELNWAEAKWMLCYAMLLCKPPVALNTRLQLSIVALLLHWSAQVRHLHNSWYWSLIVTSFNAYPSTTYRPPLSQAISYLLLISTPVDQLRTITPQCRMSKPGFSSVIWFWGSELCHCRVKVMEIKQ